jgi:hypothetical protein
MVDTRAGGAGPSEPFEHTSVVSRKAIEFSEERLGFVDDPAQRRVARDPLGSAP